MHCRYDEGPARVGWMFNMLPTSLPDADGREKSGLDMYFLEEDGGKFKVYTLSISSITLHLL
jgi:DNA polymerase epsilon subunit 1